MALAHTLAIFRPYSSPYSGLREGNGTSMTSPAEQTVVILARLIRAQCICQEEPGAVPCDCVAPVTRAQLGRVHAYLALHPERAVIYSELASEWLIALHAFLPVSEDPLEAWLQEPFGVPVEADLHHAVDLGVLLDLVDAPSSASLS
jgi:hypothetical protein